MLNDVDAFCNEVLLPRLNDGAGLGAGGSMGSVAESMVHAITGAQKEFLKDLNELSARMLDYTNNLDRRNDEHQQTVTREFTDNMAAMRGELENSLTQSMALTSQYISGLDAGVRGLNTVLSELGEKQILIQRVEKQKKGWFFGRKKDDSGE